MKKTQKLPVWYYLIITIVLLAGLIGIILSWPVFLIFLLAIFGVILAWLYLPVIIIFLPSILPFLPALNPTTDFDLASGRLIIVFLAIIGSVYIIYKKKCWFNLSTPTVLIIFLLAWSLFSGFMAEDLGRFIRKYLVFLTIFPIYFLLLAYLRKNRQWNKLFTYWSWSALLVSLIGLAQFLFQFVGGKERFFAYWGKFVAPVLYGANAGEAVASNPSWLVGIGGTDILRTISVFPDPHMLAFYLGMSIPLQCIYALKKEKYWLWILPVVSIVTLLLTFSRGSYVGLAGVTIWLMVYVLKKGISNIFIYRAVLVILVLVLTIFSISPIRDRFTSILDFNEGSNKGRLETWGEAMEVVSYNPILGVGLGNYANFVRPEADYREPIYAHNTYLDLASETGIPSAITWILLLALGIKPLFSVETQNIASQRGNKFKFYRWDLAAALGIFWFSLHSLFETPIFSPQILPLILVLIAFRTYAQETRHKKQGTNMFQKSIINV